MPDLIRHPVYSWIPAYTGMTIFRSIVAGTIDYHAPTNRDSQ